MDLQKLPKVKLLKIIEEELNGVLKEPSGDLRRSGGSLDEGPQNITSQEGVPAVPRGRVPTQKQSGIERGTAAMLNDLLSRVEELERAGEDTRKLLHQILKSMGVEV